MEPLLTEGLHISLYREQKRRGTPPLNTSAEKNPSPSMCIEKTKAALY